MPEGPDNAVTSATEHPQSPEIAPMEAASENYQPLSLLAITAVGLAILYAAVVILGGLVALLNRAPWLLPVWTILFPLAAAGLAGVARYRIQRSESTLTGLALTKWAIGLSVAVGVIYLCYFFGTFLAVRTQSRTFADAWLQSITEGKIEEAFYQTTPPPRKLSKAELRRRLELQFNSPQEPGGRGLFAMFSQADFVRLLQIAGAGAKIELVGVKEWDYERGGFTVQLSYQVTTDLVSFPMQVTVHGAESPTGEFSGRQWQVNLEMSGHGGQEGGMHFTDKGKELLTAALSGRKFASDWVDALAKGDMDKVVAGTCQPPERRAKLFDDLVRMPEGVFWTDSTLLPSVKEETRALFAANPEHKRNVDSARRHLSLRPNRIPVVRSDDKQISFGYDLEMILPREQGDAKRGEGPLAPLTVEALVIVSAPRTDAGAAATLDDKWRVTAIELVRGRTMVAPGAGRR